MFEKSVEKALEKALEKFMQKIFGADALLYQEILFSEIPNRLPTIDHNSHNYTLNRNRLTQKLLFELDDIEDKKVDWKKEGF